MFPWLLIRSNFYFLFYGFFVQDVSTFWTFPLSWKSQKKSCVSTFAREKIMWVFYFFHTLCKLFSSARYLYLIISFLSFQFSSVSCLSFCIYCNLLSSKSLSIGRSTSSVRFIFSSSLRITRLHSQISEKYWSAKIMVSLSCILFLLWSNGYRFNLQYTVVVRSFLRQIIPI